MQQFITDSSRQLFFLSWFPLTQCSGKKGKKRSVLYFHTQIPPSSWTSFHRKHTGMYVVICIINRQNYFYPPLMSQTLKTSQGKHGHSLISQVQPLKLSSFGRQRLKPAVLGLQGLVAGGARGVASGRSCQKLPPCQGITAPDEQVQQESSGYHLKRHIFNRLVFQM